MLFFLVLAHYGLGNWTDSWSGLYYYCGFCYDSRRFIAPTCYHGSTTEAYDFDGTIHLVLKNNKKHKLTWPKQDWRRYAYLRMSDRTGHRLQGRRFLLPPLNIY